MVNPITGAITCTYLKDINNEDKKAKSTKKCVIKRKPELEYYNKRLEAPKIEKKKKLSEKKN